MISLLKYVLLYQQSTRLLDNYKFDYLIILNLQKNYLVQFEVYNIL